MRLLKDFFTKNNIIVFFATLLSFFHMFSNYKRRALKFREDWSNFQPVNFDIWPFREILDNVGTKTTAA